VSILKQFLKLRESSVDNSVNSEWNAHNFGRLLIQIMDPTRSDMHEGHIRLLELMHPLVVRDNSNTRLALRASRK
jgi:hypothetical protein